jgi:hypothetical protein
MNYKIDNKLENILYKLVNVKDKYPNFSNIWREYLMQKIYNIDKQIERLDVLLNNINNLDNDIPIFLLFMLINN